MNTARTAILSMMAFASLSALEIANDSIELATLAQVDLQVQVEDSTSAYPVYSYYAPDDAGSPWGQDHSGSVASAASGSGLAMSGNAWKTVEVNYAVTADTKIDLTFDSAVASQAQGIALMSDEGATVIPMVQLGGYEVWPNGSQDYNRHVAGGGAITYSVPIGNLITAGAYKYLVLINDDDDAVSSDATLSFIWLRDEELLPVTDTETRESDTSIRVTWTAVTDAQYYVLDRKTDGVSNQIMVIFLPETAVEYLDNTVTAAATYVYNVYASVLAMTNNT